MVDYTKTESSIYLACVKLILAEWVADSPRQVFLASRLETCVVLGGVMLPKKPWSITWDDTLLDTGLFDFVTEKQSVAHFARSAAERAWPVGADEFEALNATQANEVSQRLLRALRKFLRTNNGAMFHNTSIRKGTP